jgi:hypothetical protein
MYRLYCTLLHKGNSLLTFIYIYEYNVKLSPGKSLFCLFKCEEVFLPPLIQQSTLSLHVIFSFICALDKVRPDRLDWLESGIIRLGPVKISITKYK